MFTQYLVPALPNTYYVYNRADVILIHGQLQSKKYVVKFTFLSY